jgi:hypothetical protein
MGGTQMLQQVEAKPCQAILTCLDNIYLPHTVPVTLPQYT